MVYIGERWRLGVWVHSLERNGEKEEEEYGCGKERSPWVW